MPSTPPPDQEQASPDGASQQAGFDYSGYPVSPESGAANAEGRNGSPGGPMQMLYGPAPPGVQFWPPPGYMAIPVPMQMPAGGGGSVTGNSGKPKRRQVKNACTNCQTACKRCEDVRPCSRCVKYGVQDTCVNSARKERKKGIKRGPYKKRRAAMERAAENEAALDAHAMEALGMPPPGAPYHPAGLPPGGFQADGQYYSFYPGYAFHPGTGPGQLVPVSADGGDGDEDGDEETQHAADAQHYYHAMPYPPYFHPGGMQPAEKKDGESDDPHAAVAAASAPTPAKKGRKRADDGEGKPEGRRGRKRKAAAVEAAPPEPMEAKADDDVDA